MARRLGKIEKEIGYCAMKLEKEKRIRKQVQFLQDDIEIIDRLVQGYDRRGIVPRTLVSTSDHSDDESKASRAGFLAAGLVEILQEEREILNREREELVERLKTFSGIDSKRDLLEDEKTNAMKNLSPAHSSRLRRIDDDFQRIELLWNSSTEDLVNLDGAIFFLGRNLDYLRSCRTLLISVKGDFDIGFWTSGGYLANLFRHSNVGRAKEMADGADRNLKMAQKELVCVSRRKARPELLQRVLVPLLQALFEDIFIEEKLQSSLRVIEAALAVNLKLAEQVKMERMLLANKLEQIEKVRIRMFSRFGADRSGRLVG